MTTPWPPSDADRWLKAWRARGCPPLEVGPGVTVTDLEKWFSPTAFPPPERQVARMVAELTKKEDANDTAGTEGDIPAPATGGQPRLL